VKVDLGNSLIPINQLLIVVKAMEKRLTGKSLFAVITLLGLTLVYSAALIRSFQKYDAWKQAQIERYNALRVFPSDASLWLDFNPYSETHEGRLLLPLGVALAACWLMVVAIIDLDNQGKWKIMTKDQIDKFGKQH